MTDLKSNVAEVLASSRIPLSVDDIADALRVFEYHKTRKLADVKPKVVAAAIEQLKAERAILPVTHDGAECYVVRRAVEVEEKDKQLQLF